MLSENVCNLIHIDKKLLLIHASLINIGILTVIICI